MRGHGLSVLMLESSWQQQEPALTCSGNRIVVGSLTSQRIPGRIGCPQNWAATAQQCCQWGRQQPWLCWWPSQALCCSMLSFSTCKAGWNPPQSIMEALGTLSCSLGLCINHPFSERISYWWEWVIPSLIIHTVNETSKISSQNMLGHLEESLSFCPYTILTLM